ncbi:MAG: mechanosensitive ion channel [Geminicoccaceae bacterium]
MRETSERVSPSGQGRQTIETLRLLRIVIWAVVLFQTVCLAPPVVAQTLPAEPASEGEVKPGETADLLAVLEDPQARDELIARLKALHAETAGADAATIETTVVDEFLSEVQTRQDAVKDAIYEVADSWRLLPFLGAWLHQQLTNDFQRKALIDTAMRLSLILAFGLALRLFARRWLTRRVQDRISRHAFVLGVVGVGGAAAFVVGTTSALQLVDQPFMVRKIGAELVTGLVGAWLWGTLVRAFFAKDGVITSDDRAARLLENRLRLNGQIGVIGYFFLAAAGHIGLPQAIMQFLLHILFFGIAVSLSVTTLRIREWVAQWLLGHAEKRETAITRFLPMQFLARSWHFWVIGLIALFYLVWALKIPGGFVFLARATALTAVILGVARYLLLAIDRHSNVAAPIMAEADEYLPGVQERATRYANPLRVLLRIAVQAGLVLGLLKIWETGAIEWLGSDTGQALTAKIFSLAMIGVISLLLCEGLGLLTDRFVAAEDAQGKPLHSNRARTLASIGKNVAIALIVVGTVMIALSEVGVDAAALLAGAGVVGLAIGFGSQRLVQDLINGMFILLGDTLRVGDVVEVAGKSGVVESITMRTVALRSYDGSVHTVPYSSIDTITNMTKEFSYAVLEIGVGYHEDMDRVMQVMKEVDAGLRREWPYRRTILRPLEMAGVDALGDSAVVIKARIMTRPGEQWGVRREMTRRLKMKFDELGIEIPFPHRTLYLGTDKDGKAPPLFIERLRKTIIENDSDAAEQRT